MLGEANFIADSGAIYTSFDSDLEPMSFLEDPYLYNLPFLIFEKIE